MDQNSILDLINSNVYGIWYLVGAALVFFMQCGFAMVEAGFTRAKNAGNIIMKNLMDFCLGTVVFILIGFGLLCGEDVAGIIGKPGFDIFSDYANFDWSSFVFNLVFCATAATIVSGAMAERTKFISYCIYSAVISAVIYPIETHWVWGGGWLSELGFHDFAGSAIVHMLGGTLSFVGAAILGPRIGKYTKDGKVNVIPGHNILIGALGVLILWVGWFGFNPASTGGLSDGGVQVAAKVFITTNLAACAAAITTMFFTWIRYGKPDVSMTLNGVLGGLVAITAPCDLVTPFASIIIGVVGAILMCLAIPFIDTKLKVDDPVGAISVHGICGLWGTIAVGLFASDTSAGAELLGLFYGGGLKALGVQALGAVSLIAWAAIVGSILFVVLKKAGLLRAKPQEEIEGLDSTEHGLASAYPDFVTSYNEKRSM